MNIQLLLVPYDTARRQWRSGAGPEHLLQAGLFQGRGHSVADNQVIEADPDQPQLRLALPLNSYGVSLSRYAQSALPVSSQ